MQRQLNLDDTRELLISGCVAELQNFSIHQLNMLYQHIRDFRQLPEHQSEKFATCFQEYIGHSRAQHKTIFPEFRR